VAGQIKFRKQKEMKIQVDERGYYGNFGGAFIPEMLYPNIEELRENYEQIVQAPDFQKQFNHLLCRSPNPIILSRTFV